MTALQERTARGSIARANPVTKLAAGGVVAIALVLSIDWVSASVALVLESAALLFAGVPWRRLWRSTAAVWLAAPLTGLTILLYGQPHGTVYAEWLFVRISDGSIALAIATVLRVLAIGLPSVVLLLTVDPTDLADGLAQLVRLPARFVLGALAGLRLLAVFADDWRSLEVARRARGVADRGRLVRFAGQAFALLVLAVRRGSTLATAMEARGFGAPGPRTWARPSRFAARDAAVFGGALMVAAAAVTVAVATGSWNFIAGR